MTESASSSAVTDTPPSSSPGGSPASALSRSEPMGVVSQLCGTAVSLFCASKAAELLVCTASDMGPLGVPRWLYGLIGLVFIAIPTSAYQARKILQMVLQARAGK